MSILCDLVTILQKGPKSGYRWVPILHHQRSHYCIAPKAVVLSTPCWRCRTLLVQVDYVRPTLPSFQHPEIAIHPSQPSQVIGCPMSHFSDLTIGYARMLLRRSLQANMHSNYRSLASTSTLTHSSTVVAILALCGTLYHVGQRCQNVHRCEHKIPQDLYPSINACTMVLSVGQCIQTCMPTKSGSMASCAPQ